MKIIVILLSAFFFCSGIYAQATFEKILSITANDDAIAVSKNALFFQTENEKMQVRIADYQKELYEDKGDKGINRRTAHILVRQYLNYIQRFPDSDFAPMYCFEGGKLASTIGESGDAVELWLTIYEQYHDFHLYPETMLLLAVEYETKMPAYMMQYDMKKDYKARMHAYFNKKELKNLDWNKEAEKMYKAFLAKYPKHELAPQAQASLKHLGKSPNQVVTEFKNELDSLRRTNPELQK